jgi:hypothetical protein
MIAGSSEVAYISEPFNIKHDIGICNARFDYWFTYICEQNEHKYHEHIKNLINFRYDLLGKLKQCRNPKRIIDEVSKYFHFRKYRSTGVRPLLKDPIAVFSAGWLSSKFNMDTIVIIRHPAAFAGSLKVRNWKYPFSHFIEQPLLMKEQLYPFESEIRNFAVNDYDIVDQAALLWKLIHHMILKYRRTNPNWIYMRHEDLSLNPLQGYKSLYKKINLQFSEHESKIIERHSTLKHSINSESKYYFEDIQRDSISNIFEWKNRLTFSEVARIKSGVKEISKEFYSENEW